MPEQNLDQLAGAGERIGGLQFAPLSIRRSAQFAAAITEKLGSEVSALFLIPLSMAAAAVSAGSQVPLDEKAIRTQFDQVVREHIDDVLAILSEFSGHPVEKLEALRPSEIRRVVEVLLDIPF